MSKLLLDTNVLVYSIDEDSKYFIKAQSIFNEQLELYTTSKNLSEFLSVITRLPNNLLSITDVLQIVDDFCELLTILYPDKESLLEFKNMVHKYKPVGLRIHDFEIISIALTNQINKIATFDAKDFQAIDEIELYTF